MSARARRTFAAAAIAAVLALAGCRSTSRVVAPHAELPAPVPAVEVAATPSPTPTPTPVSTPSPTPLPPPTASRREDTRSPLVRVLLQNLGAAPAFPQPGRRYACSFDGTDAVLRGPLSFRAAGGPPAVQVGAFAREDNARGVLERLRASGFRGELRHSELTRVVALAGDGESQTALEARLAKAGFGATAKPDAAPVERIAVRAEDGVERVASEVRITPLDADPVRVGSKSVRGGFVVRPVAGGVAVINVINLESYLRGVVPAEMGPRAFPAIEALKAQAVAARTYAVAHLGDHDADGYDLCDTTACQVYGGADAEHPESDAAVAATAGEIATFAGKPIDAMYHSTCAGHTEDAAAVFAERGEPYLKGVVCRGESSLSVGADRRAGPWIGGVERLALVAAALARRLGVRPEPQALAAWLGGGQAGSGPVGLAAAFDFREPPALLGGPKGFSTEGEVLDTLRAFKLPLPPPDRSEPRLRWELALVVRLGQLAGVVQAASGRIVAGKAGNELVTDAPESHRPLTGFEIVLERGIERWRRARIKALSGAPATGWYVGDDCVVLEVEPLARADARSAWTWWARELSLDEIGTRLGLDGVSDIRVTRRGVSGRALAVAITTGKGVESRPAYPFRLALDLPDTLFTVMLRQTPHGKVARFLGRGWGHGVGMCQNGAYGMALGGADYTTILKTYYSGIQIETWSGAKGGT